MGSPVVDCRSLIEFCKAYAENRHLSPNSPAIPISYSPQHQPPNPRPNPKKHCDSLDSFHSSSVAADVLILLLVLGALGTLTVPYLKLAFHGASEALPYFAVLAAELLRGAYLPYLIGSAIAFAIAVILWEFLEQQSRKCGKPFCKGLRKAVEFDIQLESEECVRCLPPLPKALYPQPTELVRQEDHKALEAELKRMAPPNGRTVLIFRKPCGCPVGRMEVWGPKKLRRIKK